jgi:hypothetical protein
MTEENFNSVEDAIRHLADITGKKVIVAAKKKVENPRKNPENKTQEDNWKKAEMWGDYKNHKYPLFDKKTGELSEKRAMTALRYINQAKGKKSYPSIESASKVLAKIIRTILKIKPSANVKYQPKDRVYKVLPESIKKKMKGYEMKSKKASFDICKIDASLRIAEEEVNKEEEKSEVKQDLKRIVQKINNSKMNSPVMKALKKEDSDSKEINLQNMTSRQAIDAIADYVAGEDEKGGEITKEEVKMAKSLYASKYEVYHDTYSSAVSEAIKDAEDQGYEADQESIDREVTFGRGRPKNGETRKHHIDLTKNGEPSKKVMHFQVTDLENDRYELNTYIN